ncbi:MAG: CPBP family intramembrane metalloprotease [Bacteroidales bacterium]|nr:CPBP family intramembrane metalloprotease [Bacteroidales bacterium]
MKTLIKRVKLQDLILIFTWLVSIAVFIWMLLQGVRGTNQFTTLRYLIQGIYVGVLIWYLYYTRSSVSQLPNAKPLIFPNSKFGKIIPALGITLMLVLCAISDLGIPLLILALIISSVWILIAWRREIKIYMLIQGFAIAIIAFIGGIPLWKNGFVSESTFIIMLLFVPQMYVAGGLLIRHTKLGGSPLFEKKYSYALRSFFLGCLLFIPFGLFNAVSDSPDTQITWVSDWWIPLSIPWFSGIAEETWFRLLLINLCYFLLYSVFQKKPHVAIIIAVLFSAITFGLGHERSLYNFLTTGLLYGLPMAVVFVKRDWEHTVGAHYMINMVPWILVFLGS